MMITRMNRMAGQMRKRFGRPMRGDLVFDLLKRTGRPEFVEKLRGSSSVPHRHENLHGNQVPTDQGHGQQNPEQGLAHHVAARNKVQNPTGLRSEEHTSELQSLMRNSYGVF